MPCQDIESTIQVLSCHTRNTSRNHNFSKKAKFYPEDELKKGQPNFEQNERIYEERNMFDDLEIEQPVYNDDHFFAYKNNNQRLRWTNWGIYQNFTPEWFMEYQKDFEVF